MKYDYNIYKKNHPDIPKDIERMFDLGFLGVEKDSPQQRSLLPFKKEKDGELTVQQESFCKKDSDRTCYFKTKKYRIMNETLETGSESAIEYGI